MTCSSFHQDNLDPLRNLLIVCYLPTFTPAVVITLLITFPFLFLLPCLFPAASSSHLSFHLFLKYLLMEITLEVWESPDVYKVQCQLPGTSSITSLLLFCSKYSILESNTITSHRLLVSLFPAHASVPCILAPAAHYPPPLQSWWGFRLSWNDTWKARRDLLMHPSTHPSNPSIFLSFYSTSIY